MAQMEYIRTFGSPAEMAGALASGRPFYSRESQVYVRPYSDFGDICVYDVPIDRTSLLERDTGDDEGWASDPLLGAGTVYGIDDPYSALDWLTENYGGYWWAVV